MSRLQPVEGDACWEIAVYGISSDIVKIYKTHWRGTVGDKERLRNGFIFLSEAEAIAAKQRIISAVKGE